MKNVSEFYEVSRERSELLYERLALFMACHAGSITDVLEWVRNQRDLDLITDDELLLMTYYVGYIFGILGASLADS